MGLFVSPDGPGMNVLTSVNEIDMAGLERLNDTKVNNIKPRVRRSVLLDSSETIELATGRFLSDIFSLENSIEQFPPFDPSFWDGRVLSKHV